MKARLVVNPEFVIGEVDPRVFGGFIEHLGRAVYEGIYEPGHPAADEEGFRRDVLDLVRELNMPVTRYPGGNFVSQYNWEDGVGPRASRPARQDLAWQAVDTNQFGTNEFVSWCRKAATTPMMAVNLGSRGLDAARNLVEYCNATTPTYWADLRREHGYREPHGISMWCLGNEMDGSWQIGGKTAEEYGRLACETAKVMKLVDPGLELVLCGSSHQGMASFGKWEASVLDHCFNQVNYLSIHQYYNNTAGNTPLFLSKPDEMSDYIRNVSACCDYVSAHRKSKKRIMLSFDEWNVWYHSGKQDDQEPLWGSPRNLLEDVYTMEDALCVGGMLISLLNHADRVKIACLAQTVNVIAPILTRKGGPALRQTIFWPFQLASKYGRGRVLRQSVTTPVYDTDAKSNIPVLTSACVAGADGRSMTVFAENRSLDKALELTVEFQGQGDFKVEWQTLHHRDLKAVNSFEAPGTVVPQAVKATDVRAGVGVFELPPASWNMIRLIQ